MKPERKISTMLDDNLYWPNPPPNVIDKLPDEKLKKNGCIRSVCKHYYKKCYERINKKT